MPRAKTAHNMRTYDQIAGNTRHYQDLFDVAGGQLRGDTATDWRKFKESHTMDLSSGNKLVIESLKGSEIMSMTLIQSDLEKQYAKGTLKWEAPAEPDYNNTTFEPRRTDRPEGHRSAKSSANNSLSST